MATKSRTKTAATEVASAAKLAIADLKPNCPDSWRWIDNPRSVDVPQGVTVILAQDGFKPLPAAPRGCYEVSLTLTVISPYKDPAVAEDKLNEAGNLIASALDLSPILSWTDANRVVWQDESPAYDFTLTIPFATESETN